MKVLLINTYYAYGSTGNIVQDLYLEGTKNGLEMYAIYWLLKNKNDDLDHVFYCGEESDRSGLSKVSEWVLRGGKLTYNQERTRKIISIIKKINPDIIHLHNLHGDFEFGSIDFPFFIKSIAKMNKKIIWTFHDCWPITGRCYYFEYKKCNGWKYGCGNCPQRLFDREGVFKDWSRINWLKKEKLYSLIKNLTVVTVSEWLSNMVKQSMLSDRRIITIYNGIDIETFNPYAEKDNRIKNEKDDKFVVLCIGWDRRKGYKDYYKLAKLLSFNEKIVVVGNRPLFRQFSRLPKNIETIPAINNPKEMASIYRMADVYYNASPAETFGLTTAEAMACGTPVVGYDSTATPEIIGESGVCGYIVKRSDVQQVLKSIKKIRKGETEFENNCFDRVVQNFDRKVMLERYIELYKMN